MARASTLTKLPLDRYAEIVGFNPLHFNGITTALAPDSACNSGEDYWKQYPYQDAAKVSREDLASAIREAEEMLEAIVGYKLLPEWVIDERRQSERPAIRDLYAGGVNPRWLAKSVRTRWGYVQSGGQRAKTLISAGVAIVRSDGDGDGYQETCTVTVASTVVAEEIRVYFPGESGADEWEVRPVRVVDNGATLTLTFKIWQVPDPDLWERLSTDNTAIDGDVAGSFITTVDVYRVWNDPQTQVQFLWEPDILGACSCGSATCTVCTLASQYGCLHVRDTRLGILGYAPATWDATDSAFDSDEWSVCREPERMRLWYYSGWRWETNDARKRATVDLDPYWEKPIAYLATALLEREVCACNNVEHFLDYYREDLARNGANVSYQNSRQHLDNPFGTRRGMVYAWQRTQAEERTIQR